MKESVIWFVQKTENRKCFFDSALLLTFTVFVFLLFAYRRLRAQVPTLQLHTYHRGHYQTSMPTHENLDRYCSELSSGSDDESLAAARSLRNSCAGNEENALHLIQTNIIEWIANHCREVALLKLVDHSNADLSHRSSSVQHRQSFILALCQFLSNLAACGEGPSHYLWSSAFGVCGFSDLLAASVTVKSRKATAAAISSIHNSVKHAESGQNSVMKKLCCSRSLAAHLLLSAAPSTLQLEEISYVTDATIQPGVSLEDVSSRLTDPVIDWLHIVFFHLLSSNNDNVQRMFLVLKPRSLTESVWAPDNENSCNEAACQPLDCFYYENNEAFQNTNRAVLTHEQIILLQIVLTIFEDSSLADKLNDIDYPAIVCSTPETGIEGVNSVNATKKGSVIEGFLVTIAVLTNVLYERYCMHRKSYVTSSDPGSDETTLVSALWSEDYSEMLLLALNVIGAGVSYLPRDLGSELRGVVGAERTKILNTCCCILKDNDAKKLAYMAKKVEERKRHQEDLIRVQNKGDESMGHTREHCQGGESSSDIQPDGTSRHIDSSKEERGGRSSEIPYRLTAEEEKEGELVKAALQVIGNLAYGCSSVQDALRESGGLALCLSHCSTDFRLPFAREWGLFSLRNICEMILANLLMKMLKQNRSNHGENKKNQDFISALQPQKIVQDDYLQSLGVSVQIDPQTGKISATSAPESSPS